MVFSQLPIVVKNHWYDWYLHINELALISLLNIFVFSILCKLVTIMHSSVILLCATRGSPHSALWHKIDHISHFKPHVHLLFFYSKKLFLSYCHSSNKNINAMTQNRFQCLCRFSVIDVMSFSLCFVLVFQSRSKMKRFTF